MMVKFKKIAAVFTTIAAIAINGTSAISVSAEYDSCDVNRDGSVGVSDIAILNKYLNGQFSVSNYNQLDVNKSLTIDAADSECILAKVLKDSYEAKYVSRNGAEADTEVEFPTISELKLNTSATNTASREYMRYSYIEQKQLENYTLTPTFSTLSMSDNSRGIIGIDNRYRADGEENTGIVRLSTGGTGFIVGDHQIATAAHCVYGGGTWASIEVNTYNYDGTISSTKLTPIEVHIPAMYTSTYAVAYDYALITVEEDLSDYVHFSLGNSYNVTSGDYADVPIYVTGCPQPVYEGTDDMISNEECNLYSAQGNVIKTTDVYSLLYNVYTSGGNSGGPVYTITKNSVGDDIYYTYTALAVNFGGANNIRNFGSMITNYHLQFYKNNPNASYTVY